MGHGYLAVDFFFILSGFVIAKAYERNLQSNMSFRDFALVRIGRLYPLLIAATLVATAYMVMTNLRGGSDLKWLIILPAALLALPDPSATFAPDPFPLLPVVWSLFFELVANFLYAGFARWLTTGRLSVLVLLNGAILAVALYGHGNGELGNTYATLWAGVPRVLFSFLAGVLCHRLHATLRLISPAISPVVLAALLFGTLAVPHELPWFFDASCIFIGFPLVLVAAMNNEPTESWRSVARFSADISYPLYLFHLPLILWVGFGLAHFHVPLAMQQAAELIVVPGLAYAAFAWFDRPIQSVLKARRASTTVRPVSAPDARAL
jgi:peptidoglycan/LPS O-acetylase OafA/YrhL